MCRQNSQMLQLQAELFSLSQPITSLPDERPTPGLDDGRPGFTPVILTCPELVEGETYTVTVATNSGQRHAE